MRKSGEKSVELVHAIDIGSSIRLNQQLKHRDCRGYGLSSRAFKPHENGGDYVDIFFVTLDLKDKNTSIQPNLRVSPKKIGQPIVTRYQLSLSLER